MYDLGLGKEFFEALEEVDFGNIGPDLSRDAPFEEGIVSKVDGTVEDFPTVGPGLQAVYLQVRPFGVQSGFSGAAEDIGCGVIVAAAVEVGVGVIKYDSEKCGFHGESFDMRESQCSVKECLVILFCTQTGFCKG